MSRLRVLAGATRSITAADDNTAIPAAITDATVTLPAGVVNISGASLLAIDISSTGTTAGNFTLQLLVFDGKLSAWVLNSELTIAGMDTLPTPRAVSPRTYVTNCLGHYAFPLVKTLATNTTAAVISVHAGIQDT